MHRHRMDAVGRYRARGRGRVRHPFALGGIGALLGVVALGATLAVLSQRTTPQDSQGCRGRHQCISPSAKRRPDPPPLTVVSTEPAAGATGVASNTTVAIRFSSALEAQNATPTLTPAVLGTWMTSGRTMEFSPSAPFVPFVKYTLTVPGGTGGVAAANGAVLSATDSVTFTIGPGSVTRLQQLLAQLGYLPLSFQDLGPLLPPRDMAIAHPGSFAWRWSGLPSSLTGQWAPGVDNEITKAAIMSFETQNGLSLDGKVGPTDWTALLADVGANRANTRPLSYVLVTKALPEHLTVWVNGALTFSHVLVNTGVPGATTPNGTFVVFEHVQMSNMKGTDVTGHKYDVTVPWASYFTWGGDALHGYPRPGYGYPQSNGCVEMAIPTAQRVWPSTPIGTIVTVA